jgi:hypothetical protein
MKKALYTLLTGFLKFVLWYFINQVLFWVSFWVDLGVWNVVLTVVAALLYGLIFLTFFKKNDTISGVVGMDVLSSVVCFVLAFAETIISNLIGPVFIPEEIQFLAEDSYGNGFIVIFLFILYSAIIVVFKIISLIVAYAIKSKKEDKERNYPAPPPMVTGN